MKEEEDYLNLSSEFNVVDLIWQVVYDPGNLYEDIAGRWVCVYLAGYKKHTVCRCDTGVFTYIRTA